MELEVLGDRYELQEPIGRGGMATIYRAVDLRMGRTVAAKILREVYSTDPKFVTRFQREARAASALQHPNIVQVFDYGQSGESYFIVMEFVEGADLRRYLKKNGQLDNDRAIEIAHDVALGLGAAHKRGIVHRDVKPQNIMLNDDGLVKLTDFGIASMYKDAEAERLTTTGMTLGTVQYYAPEQAQGEIVSPAADIYALGIVMYEMLAGRTPFDGDTPVAIAMRHIQDAPDPPTMYNPRIAPGLERIILRCLEKDPRDRFRDGDALAYALENVSRSPRRASGAVGTPAGGGGRSQFAPLALPSTEGRPNSDGRAGQGAFGAPALMSGPARGGRPSSQPFPERTGMGYGGDFASGNTPTYNDVDRNGVTRPNGPALGTVPRSPTPGRGSGPYGALEGPVRPKRNGPIVATVVISAVLLLGLGCFLTLSMTGALKGLSGVFGSSATPVPTVVLLKVPTVVGVDHTQAIATLQADHFAYKEVQQASTQPKGQVISQDPAANSMAQPGQTITITVSSGPDKVPVPQLIGSTQQQAEDTLTKAGLQYNIQVQSSTTVNFGYVISTNPLAGTQVQPSSIVTVYVSSGPPPTATPVVTATPTATACPSSTPTGTPASPSPGGCG